jgi:hypothetical protein
MTPDDAAHIELAVDADAAMHIVGQQAGHDVQKKVRPAGQYHGEHDTKAAGGDLGSDQDQSVGELVGVFGPGGKVFGQHGTAQADRGLEAAGGIAALQTPAKAAAASAQTAWSTLRGCPRRR